MQADESMRKARSISITFRTYPEIKARIDELAEAHDASMGWVINRQLKEMLSDQTKQDIDNKGEIDNG